MEIFREELKDRLGKNLAFDLLLKDYTTIGTGGIADYYYVAEKIDDLINAVTVAHRLNIPYLIIGSGSNIVFSDMGYKGLVIRNNTHNIVINQDTGEVIADSGVIVSKLLNQVASNNLGGIEFMAGIPGTLGGAIYGNAGSGSLYIGDYVKSITFLDKVAGELKMVTRPHTWMEFSYRSTKLKRQHKEDFRPLILTAHIRMSQKRYDEILKNIQDYIQLRKEKQPLNEKSCGSFFKNPGKLPEQAAGYLLDRSGAKKLRVGGAAVSKKHANFIINQKDASSADIKKVADKAKQLVFDNYDISLEEEIEYFGDW